MTTITHTKEDAEVLKLLAEAEAAREDAATSRLEQQLKTAEIARVNALTAKEAAEGALADLARQERQRLEDVAKLQDYYAYKYVFDSQVSDGSVEPLLNTMDCWHRQDPNSSWEIVIRSPGGSVTAGMHLFDQIAAYSILGGGTHRITITVRGYAASMGGILLQAADERVIGAESYLMIHEVSAGTGGKIGDIKDDVKWYEKVCERIANVFVKRSNGGIDLPKFKRNWERHDWWIDSAEALELGFVDRIG